MIKNLIFDIAGIFITSDEEEILKIYSEKMRISYEDMRNAYDKFYKGYEAGKLVRGEFTKLVFDGIKKEVPPDFWIERLKLKHLFEEMFDFLNNLKKKYNCYFISNEGKEYWKEIDDKLKISRNFIDGIVSFEAGVRKPDIKIFKMLLDRNNLNPSECVFIDDSAGNLDGARQLGMKALLYEDVGQLKKDLKEIGVNI